MLLIVKKLFVYFLLGVSIGSCTKHENGEDKEKTTILDQPLSSVSRPEKSTEDWQAPEGALPLVAQPTHYQLDLDIDPGKDTFSAYAKITINLKQDATGIWLHGKNLRVHSSTLTKSNNEVISVSYAQILDSGVARIEFGQIIEAGNIALNFNYEADFDTNLSGLFKVTEQGDNYILAKSESIQARKYLPGFDQPGFKSPFLISMTIPTGLQAISNAPIASQTDLNDKQTKIEFSETRPMPTYLLSIAVGPFDIVDFGVIPKNTIRDFDIPLRAIARRDRGKDMNFIMGITPRFVEIFEQSLRQPYPFKKLDIVAAPQWPSGATELSAAITYREQLVLLGDSPAPGAKLKIQNTHAHELAHMWFGNLVTPPWWDDLWLKEGFATWATPVVLTQFEPGAGHELDALKNKFDTMNNDSMYNTRAIRQPILKNDNIRNAYDSITYRKSQAIIHMVDSYFGAAKFREAMGSYVAEYADGIADSVQFYQSIADKTGEKTLSETFKQFAEQKGIPLMEMKIQCDQSSPTSILINQSRYRPLGSEITTNPTWTVPMCIRYSNGESIEKSCGLVNPEQNQFHLKSSKCPDWIMPNADGNGYYRWQLDNSYFQALFNNYEQLNSGEKMALLDAVISSFEAGNLNQAALLNAVEISSKSSIRQIVEFPLEKLGYYIDRVFNKQIRQNTIAEITPWYLNQLDKLNQSQNLKSKNSERKNSGNQQLLKNKLLSFLALNLKHAKTRKLLIGKATKYIEMNGEKSKHDLSSDLYTAALTVAVEDLGKPFFDQLLAARNRIDDPLFDNASASALGVANEKALGADLHNYALSEKIGGRESYAMITAMLQVKSMREIHWPWYKKNLSLILKKIPSQWRRRSPRLANIFCDIHRLTELDELFQLHASEAPGYELALAQTKESISLCSALKGR